MKRGIGIGLVRTALLVIASIAVVACGGGDSGSAPPPGSSPTVGGVSGTASHGNSLTITGSSFGNKSHAGPAIHDDFDNAGVGNISGRGVPIHQGIFSSYSTWEVGSGGAGAGNIVGDNNGLKARSTGHARATFDNVSFWSLRLEVSGDNFSTGDERYISFYYRHRRTSANYAKQTKAWIAYPAGSGTDAAYWSTAFDVCETGGWRKHLSETASEQLSSIGGPDIDNEWVRFETYLKQSAPGAANGAWHHTTYRPTLGAPAKEVLTWDNTIMRTSPENWEFWEFGGAFWDMCDLSTDTGTVDIDEFYMDGTPARVEVCNASTYSASTQCELQLPTAWSSTSITFRFNRGYLGAGPAYVYVISPAGDVSAVGHAITILP